MDQEGIQGSSSGIKLHPQEVKPFFVFIEKAFRAVSLYSENHPLLKQFIKQFTDYLNLATQKLQDPLVLKITQYQVFYDEEVVYDGPKEVSSNLALLLYNGGLSNLSFIYGVTEEEVQTFLLALWKSKSVTSDEESLSTVLWDLNFQSIQYQCYDELTMYDTEVPDFANIVERDQYHIAIESNQDSTKFTESTEFFNLLSEEEIVQEFTLTESESALLEEDIGTTESPAIQFVWAALRLYDLDRDPKIFTNILRTIKNRLRFEIEEGEFSNAALMIQQIEAAKLAFNLTPENIGELSILLQNFVNAELLERTVKILQERESVNWHAVKCCFAYTPIACLPQLIPFLGHPKMRETFIEVLRKFCTENVSTLFPFLKHEDPQVIIAVCTILEGSEERSIFKPLMELINHTNPQVKDVTLSLLYRKFPKETADLFITKLSDPDKNIRKVARDNLPKIENKQVYLKIFSMIEDSEFLSKDLIEKRELLNAFAVCGQNQAIVTLERLLQQSSGFTSIFRKESSAKMADNRKCAVRALAYIQDEKALKMLQEVEKSKNSDLSVLAKIALSEREKLIRKPSPS